MTMLLLLLCLAVCYSHLLWSNLWLQQVTRPDVAREKKSVCACSQKFNYFLRIISMWTCIHELWPLMSRARVTHTNWSGGPQTSLEHVCWRSKGNYCSSIGIFWMIYFSWAAWRKASEWNHAHKFESPWTGKTLIIRESVFIWSRSTSFIGVLDCHTSSSGRGEGVSCFHTPPAMMLTIVYGALWF